MSYCTQTDLLEEITEEVLVSLTDIEGETGAVVASRVTSAIERAEAVINGYIGGRVSVPLADPVPDTIREMAVDIAIFTLFTRVEQLPKFREKRYEDAIRWLESYRDEGGSIGAPGEEGGSGTSGAPVYDVPEADFTEDVWELY